MICGFDFRKLHEHGIPTLKSWSTAIVTSLLAFSLGCGGSGSGGPPPPPPPTTSYTIGGTVSGLNGSLLLENNGGDALAVNSNGSFSFSKSVNSGGTYDVTPFVQPQTPVQFCVVSNGQGIAMGNVSSVQVTCTTPIEQTLYDFGPASNNSNPSGNLVLDSSGSLYGTTEGAQGGYGEVFKLTPSNGHWVETVLYAFCQLPNCLDGSSPSGGVIRDAAGNLYGATTSGGAYGGGTVFELVPGANGTWTENVLHSFGNGTDGSGLKSGLIFDHSGNLYGTTYLGGNSACSIGCGTVFELSPSAGSWSETVIYSFCSVSGSFCPDGANPRGGVVLDAADNLYGTTYFGGGSSVSNGLVFELSPGNSGTWTEKVLYRFQGGSTDGANPASALVFDTSGNLYGTTVFGYEAVGINNGVVFKLSPESGGQWKETIVYGFCGLPNFCPDGSTSYASVIFDKAGNLYGTATEGGSYGQGVVFALAPGPRGGLWSLSPLYSFQGGLPSSGVVMDATGNLFGVAGGGTNGAGLVFEVTP
jgi:uncharacterized repeat protein (TIGR03803 family)